MFTVDFHLPRDKNSCTSICPFLPICQMTETSNRAKNSKSDHEDRYSNSNNRIAIHSSFFILHNYIALYLAYVCVKCRFTIHLDRRKKCLTPLSIQKCNNYQTILTSVSLHQPLLTTQLQKHVRIVVNTLWGHFIHILH